MCPKTLSGHLSRVLFCSHFKSSTVFLPNVIIEYKNWFVQSDKCKRFSCKTISASKIDQTLTDQPKFTNFSMRIVMVFFVCLSVSSLSISFSCRCLVFFNSAFEFFFWFSVIQHSLPYDQMSNMLNYSLLNIFDNWIYSITLRFLSHHIRLSRFHYLCVRLLFRICKEIEKKTIAKKIW